MHKKHKVSENFEVNLEVRKFPSSRTKFLAKSREMHDHDNHTVYVCWVDQKMQRVYQTRMRPINLKNNLKIYRLGEAYDIVDSIS